MNNGKGNSNPHDAAVFIYSKQIASYHFQVKVIGINEQVKFKIKAVRFHVQQ